MEFLVRLLDDPDPAPCGHCVNCTGRGLPRTVDDELVRAAVSFLRRDLRTIKPRLQWPPDAVPGLSGKIAPPNRAGHGPVRLRRCRLGPRGPAGAERGPARSAPNSSTRPRRRSGSAGTRRRPRVGDGRAVVAVPGMVDGFARALADRLGSPLRRRLLDPPDGAEPQTAMQNSVQQLRNAHGKLGIDAGSPCCRVPCCSSTTSSIRAGR